MRQASGLVPGTAALHIRHKCCKDAGYTLCELLCVSGWLVDCSYFGQARRGMVGQQQVIVRLFCM
jgi:hypothetical protein